VFDAQTLGVTLDETTSLDDLNVLLRIFNSGKAPDFSPAELTVEDLPYDVPFGRKTPLLTHPVFNRYHSETEMLRYIRRLEAKDLSLTTSMIPLGSCTMKLNATPRCFP
jgi:glycine dehydrogenase